MSTSVPSRPLRPERWRRNPHLYQVNAVTWVRRFSGSQNSATLEHIPDQELDLIAGLGFDLLWLMGVWTKGPLGVRMAREVPGADEHYRGALPDFRPEDVVGSPFAVAAYDVAPELGGEGALESLRQRLAARGVGLVLDFVPNHTARDHPWVRRHPERYVSVDAAEADRRSDRYFRADTDRGPRAIAFGKDPHFSGWTDTAQLDWTNPEVHEAMARELARIATRCDGVRCDMAMLLLPDIFPRTWPERANRAPDDARPFWPAAIAAARAAHASFVTIAEVYWGLEGRLLELGFDYVYDKDLYDRLRGGDVPAIRRALEAPGVFRRRAVHFIANHDEAPPAAAFGTRERAAATLVMTIPGMRFVHESQLDGRRVRLPVQLGRNAASVLDDERLGFYRRLLAAAGASELRDGEFRLAPLAPMRSGDERYDRILAALWEHGAGAAIVAVNLGEGEVEGRVRLRFLSIAGQKVAIDDLLGESARTVVSGDELLEQGLAVRLSSFGARVLRVAPADAAG